MKTNILSPRQAEISKLICYGETNESIGRKLGISSKTVERHRGNTYIKLGVNNTLDLLRVCLKDGMLKFDHWVNHTERQTRN